MMDAYSSQSVMNRQTLLLLGLLSCLGSSADSLLAQDAPELAGQSYELGVGYLANDAYRFGRYNGLQQQGPYLIGDINVQEYVGEER